MAKNGILVKKKYKKRGFQKLAKNGTCTVIQTLNFFFVNIGCLKV